MNELHEPSPEPAAKWVVCFTVVATVVIAAHATINALFLFQHFGAPWPGNNKAGFFGFIAIEFAASLILAITARRMLRRGPKA
jgi:hypothetical protein